MQLGYSTRTIRHNIQCGNWVSRATGEIRRGSELREVRLDSLPAARQRKWAQHIAELPNPECGMENADLKLKIQNPQSKIETWLSKGDVLALGVSPSTFTRRIRSREWASRQLSGGRNGKGQREVLLESLPQDLQMAWWQANRAVEPEQPEDLEQQATASERLLTESLLRYPTDERKAFLAEAQRLAGICARFEALEPKRIGSGNKTLFVKSAYDLCEEARCTCPVVLDREPRRAKPPSPRTLEQWAIAYRKIGLPAFLRKPAKAAVDDRRKAAVSAPAVEWINQFWRNYPSPKHLHEALRKLAAKNGWVIPSETWIRRRFNSLPKIVETITFKGQKTYTGRYAPYVPRDHRDLEALQLLCGDHSVRDVTVMLPTGELTRPWLTVWLDLRTYLIWGWHLDLTPSSNTIGLAYVNGVKTFGAQPLSNPEADFYSWLYTDQGKDYRCKTLTGKTLVFKQAAKIDGGLNVLCTQRKVGFMEEMGLKHLLARGYNGREKPVERIFRDFSDWEQNHFDAEYCGRDAKNKPDRWVRAWHRHEKLLKKFPGNMDALYLESPFISLDDYRDALAARIIEFNNSQHKRVVLGGATIVPQEEYNRLYTTRYDISEDALALLLMKTPPNPKTITKNGIQMFQPHWNYLDPAMSEFKGEKVEVRYSDGDYSRIWAVLPNGKVVEASLVTPSSILNPNKKTLETIAKQAAHERKVAREFQFIQQSNYRGESVEDRVAAQLTDPDDLPPTREKIAVNAGPRIHNLTRFDTPKLSGSAKPSVTADQVEQANVIEGLFGEKREKPRIREEWE